MVRRSDPQRAGHKLLDSKYIEARVRGAGDAFRAAGAELADSLVRSVTTYIELLLRWNRKVNLTTITDVDEIISRNFLESFFGARFLATAPGCYCDVGSGAGFPGLAVKLVRPGWQASLFEPNHKKAAFLSEVGRSLALQGLAVESVRWQDAQISESSIDAVMARALGDYESLIPWAAGRVRRGGRALLWLGAADADALRRLAGFDWHVEPIPHSRERVLLVGTKL